MLRNLLMVLQIHVCYQLYAMHLCADTCLQTYGCSHMFAVTCMQSHACNHKYAVTGL